MNRLKLLREERGMKQSELGKLLNVKDAAISKYESGKVPLTADTLVTLSEIFNVSIDYLLGRDTTNNYNMNMGTIFGFSGGDEVAETFQHKLCNQIDYKNTKLADLASGVGVSEKTILNWLLGKDTSYSDYYQALSEFFHVQPRYWTSPHALSPGIEPDIEEYLLILLYREYKDTGVLNELYGSLKHYFPGISVLEDTEENKFLSAFRDLNEDNRDIIIGEIKKCLKEQRYEESVAADEELREAK